MDSKKLNDFSLQETFFIRLNFKRGSSLPSPIEVPIGAEIKVIDKDFPKLQVNLRVSSPGSQPINIDIEMVAIFNYIGKDLDRGRDQMPVFLRDKGLHMLWPAMALMMKQITGQMGMPPLNTKTPIMFDIPLTHDEIVDNGTPPPAIEAEA